MMTYDELQALIPDLPRDIPAYKVNPPLWAFWRRLEPNAQETPIMTEAEIAQRLDLMYMGNGDC
jgi:hypothetical protein